METDEAREHHRTRERLRLRARRGDRRALAKRGAHVVGIDLPDAIGTATPIDGVTLVAADVTDPAQVSAAVAEAAGARCERS